jgi:flagellar protein FliS
MSSMQRAMSAYGQAAQTLAPAQQIVRLYEGALRRIKEARAAIEAGRHGDRYVAVAKATAIIDGLQSCLDLQQGGEIAANLDRLYSHIGFRLQAINLEDDVRICDELIGCLEPIHRAWSELGQRPAASPTPVRGEPASGGEPLRI